MRHSTLIFSLFALLLSFSLAACGGEGQSGTSDTFIGGNDTSTAPDTTTGELSLTFDVSSCGGFAAEADGGGGGEGDPLFQNYCDAELLYWTYDPAAGRIDFRNNRVILNCCGEHSVEMVATAELASITEVDAPEEGDMRCNCMCAFDYEFSVAGVSGDSFELQLHRHVTDQSDIPETLLGETLDLSAGNGVIIIDDQAHGMCME